VDFRSYVSRFDTVVDCRSPAEYAEDHLPGAISAPVLDDAERATIGTLYKRASPFDAKKLGAALVAKNVARHIETLFAGKGREWRPLVYCWRGGKRSAAMAHILREVGWDAQTLPGGYREYRRCVVRELETLPQTLDLRVVHGPTGSGKSRLLAALRRARAQVLDLEDLAAHRGSVLGTLPERPQPTQKWFESLLLQELAGFDRACPVFVEGESKKIGQLQVPEALIAAMRASPCIVLDTSIEARIDLLLQEYRHFVDDPLALGAQLDCLAGLHGREKVAGWKALAQAGAWHEFVRRLLLEHYDPAYRRSSQRNFAQLAEAPRVAVGSADDAGFDAAARALVETLRADGAAAAREERARIMLI
jgi:tRNA 2-selenouridine synthase